MFSLYLILGFVCFGLLAYLLASLIHPEWFN